MIKTPWVISEIKSIFNAEGIYSIIENLTDIPIYYRIMPENTTRAIIFTDVSFINGIYTYRLDYVNLSRCEIGT